MNISVLIGLIAGVVIILSTQQFETGSVSSLFRIEAFLIVIGATFSAALVNFGFGTLKNAFISAKDMFLNKSQTNTAIISDMLDLAHFARKNGLLQLMEVVDDIEDSFLRRGIQLIVDIPNPQLVKEIMESEILYTEEQELISSRVFEALGGYAPTFGIVGAVIGLIQVMAFIQEPAMLASGIATAFVATLYGVGVANLVFLPIAGKLKLELRDKILLKEVILQGILSIKMNENPTIMEEKMIAYLNLHNKKLDWDFYQNDKVEEIV